eukprot:UN34240
MGGCIGSQSSNSHYNNQHYNKSESIKNQKEVELAECKINYGYILKNLAFHSMENVVWPPELKNNNNKKKKN